MHALLHIALRVLLCVGFVLNGSDYAAAAMQATSCHGAVSPASQGHMTEPGCEGHAPEIGHAKLSGAIGPGIDADAEPHPPGCCDPSTCQHICHVANPAAPVLPLPVMTRLGHDMPAAALATAQLPPARTRLNRPPIH